MALSGVPGFSLEAPQAVDSTPMPGGANAKWCGQAIRITTQPNATGKNTCRGFQVRGRQPALCLGTERKQLPWCGGPLPQCFGLIPNSTWGLILHSTQRGVCVF